MQTWWAGNEAQRMRGVVARAQGAGTCSAATHERGRRALRIRTPLAFAAKKDDFGGWRRATTFNGDRPRGPGALFAYQTDETGGRGTDDEGVETQSEWRDAGDAELDPQKVQVSEDPEDNEEEEEAEEEETEDSELVIESYAYDDDNEIGASLFDFKTGDSVDEDEDDNDDYGEDGGDTAGEEAVRGGGGDAENGNGTGLFAESHEDEYVDGNDEDGEEVEDEYGIEYLDPSDWRSLQLLAESDEGEMSSGELDLVPEDSNAFARDVLIEMHDSFLAASFLKEACEQQWRVLEHKTSLSILPQFGTSTRRKRRGGKKAAASVASDDLDLGDDKDKAGEAPALDMVHPARTTGTSEWYPETSERCLHYHESLRSCALEGRGDDAIIVLEEMRIAGILPGPKAYHAALHAYAASADLIGAANVMRKAFEMMVPVPLESALVITRMGLLSEEEDWSDFETLLLAWSWLGFDTDAIANEALVAMLGEGTSPAGEDRVGLVLEFFEKRKGGAIKWRVDRKGLLVLVENLCKTRQERRVADLLQFDLDKEELGLLGAFHLEPLIAGALGRGELEEALYQLKVCLLIVSPYLDFKRGLISMFHTVLEAGGDLQELEILREQHCVVPDNQWSSRVNQASSTSSTLPL